MKKFASRVSQNPQPFSHQSPVVQRELEVSLISNGGDGSIRSTVVLSILVNNAPGFDLAISGARIPVGGFTSKITVSPFRARARMKSFTRDILHLENPPRTFHPFFLRPVDVLITVLKNIRQRGATVLAVFYWSSKHRMETIDEERGRTE